MFVGSGFNTSIAVSNSARHRASSRTPVHFWLDVPLYEYDIGCGNRDKIHTFCSRTPLIAAEEHDDFIIVWCELCRQYRMIYSREPEPLNQPISNDELISFEQDKGILRERIGLFLQDQGFLSEETEIMEAAIQFGVPVREIKKINAGLKAPEGLAGVPDLCKAGLHEMTVDNISLSRGRRQCKACRTLAQRSRRAAKTG